MSDPVPLRPPAFDGAALCSVDPETSRPTSDALRPLVSVLAEIAERIERERLTSKTASDAA